MRINPTPTLTMSSKKSESGDAADAAGGSGNNNSKDPNVGGTADLGINHPYRWLAPWRPSRPRPRADNGSFLTRPRTSLR